MKKINFTTDVLPHLLVVAFFLIVTLIFFKPVFFDNKSLSQQDIEQHVGSSKSLHDYRDATGKEGLWTNSMFSGMPAYLVNLQWSDGPVVILKNIFTLFLPHPVNNIFAAFLAYYILLLAFRIRPYVAASFAIAFGLSTYMIIGLSVGHNARIGAIAFMPLVMAGIHLAFRGKRIIGAAVTALGLALHLRENHLQMTYYLMIIVGVYGLIQLVLAIRQKQLAGFFRRLIVLVPAALLAAATFFGQFWAITEYTRYSIRGPSELGGPTADGLPKSYAFEYTYGIWEPSTLLIPEFYGGTSRRAFIQDQNSASYKALVQAGDNQLANRLVSFTGAYWGPQNATAGPYYAGAIIVFFFVLGILFAPREYVWWLASLSLLSIMLSWGSSFATFNYFMFDYFPGYNKFRSFSFGLVIALFCMPLLGAMGLERFLEDGLNKLTKRKLIVAFSLTGGLCLLLVLFAGLGNYTRSGENSVPVWFARALREDRMALLRWDSFRSFAFIFAVFVLLFLDIPRKIAPNLFLGFLSLAIVLDLGLINRRYFTQDNYHRVRGKVFFEPSGADTEILKDKSVYRVYNLDAPFNEGLTSYYHNSLGGYHGAKLKRYQDLYDSGIVRDTKQFIEDVQTGKPDFRKYGVLDMLNAKYFVYGPEAGNIFRNPSANGNAWFVGKVISVSSPAEELKSVSVIDTRHEAVVDKSKFTVTSTGYDSTSRITLTEQTPPDVKYESESSTPGFAVFSEIYYPKGWHAFIDGNEVPIVRTDYVLRGLEVPAGKHAIEFRFEPKPYTVGNKITLASSWALLLFVLGSIGVSLNSWRKEQPE